MSVNLLKTTRKLLSALNLRGYNLTFATKQFVGREGNMHTYYTVNQAQWNDDKNRYVNVELYSSGSVVRITLFLRDMWFLANDWELPTDNELWNILREEIAFNG